MVDKMKDKWKVVAISLAVIIVIAILVSGIGWGYQKVTFSYYENGFIDGTQNVLLVINQNIAQQGYVQIILGNQSVILAPIQLEE